MKSRYVGACLSVVLALGLSSCDDDDNPAAGDLTVTCAAVPSSGLAPLSVTFDFRVVGAGPGQTLTASVNYGDGTTSNDPDAPHTYVRAGSFTVTFSAASGGRSASCNASVNVTAPTGPAAPTGNQAPNAVFKTTPPANGGNIQGKAPLDVQFNMCPTTDPDRDRLRFTMDFTNDGQLDVDGTTGAECRRGTTYPRGSFRARICVTDLDGGFVPIHPPQCENYTIDSTP
jgi:PKD domain